MTQQVERLQAEIVRLRTLLQTINDCTDTRCTLCGRCLDAAAAGVPRPTGFHNMSVDRQREIAALGGKAAHAQGRGHQWTPEEARTAGKKGGAVTSAAYRITRRVLGLAGVLLFSATLAAQGPVIEWTYYIYSPTLQEAIIVQPMNPLFVNCDQEVPVVPPGSDPAIIVWEDNDRPGRVCVWIDPPPGPLRNIPPGSYLLGLVATVDGVDHPESVRVAFVKKMAGGVVIIARNVRVL